MFLSEFLKRIGHESQQRPRAKRRKQPASALAARCRSSYGLRLETLEGRALLSAVPFEVPSGRATHLALLTPPVALSGLPSPVEVVALDANNHLAVSYAGTIAFTSSDGSAQLPPTFTFTAADHGQHLFFASYATAGPQTIAAADQTDATIQGDAKVNVIVPAAATHFAVGLRSHVDAGSPVGVYIAALDANNHLVPNFTGTVTIASSDPNATLPSTYTFTADDHGRHFFKATFATVGPQSVTVANADNSITGVGNTTVNAPAVATHFAVMLPPHTEIGLPAPVVIWALDANNHPVPNFTGTLSVTSTDPLAKLPASITLGPGNPSGPFEHFGSNGNFFTVTFGTAGPQSITVTNADSSVTGSASTTVDPADVVTHFALVLPPQAPSGASVPAYVLALGADNHPVWNYTGTVQLTSTDPTVAAQTYSFLATDHGVHVFKVAFGTVGPQSVTVTDTNDNTISATAKTQVTAAEVAAALQILVPPNAPAGVPMVVIVLALDANGKPLPFFGGLISLTSSDPTTKIGPLPTLGPGGPGASSTGGPSSQNSNAFLVTFGATGPQTLTATDTADSLTGVATVNVGKGWGIFDPPPPGGH